MSKEITIEHAVKRYGDQTIITDLSLSIRNKELFTLLGPSGCGKTTLLRMIAGFNTMEGGTISFNGSVINQIPAHKRNIGMVFQDYAVFPHLTVEQNVRYGLKEHKVPKEEADSRVEKILGLTRIKEYRSRLPENLSGGQQQRVALARAIAIHPDVLLMDEPLSNLDAKLRVEMRGVIRDIQKEIGITTVYVTHDQEEALAISDRIAVMNKGDIQQVAVPHSIYTRPYNLFVADFVGHSNFLYGEMSGSGSRRKIALTPGYSMELDNILEDAPAGRVVVSIRPEEFYLSDDGTGVKARIEKATYLGKYIIYFVRMEGCSLYRDRKDVEISQDLGTVTNVLQPGDDVWLKAYPHKVNVYLPETGVTAIRGVAQYD